MNEEYQPQDTIRAPGEQFVNASVDCFLIFDFLKAAGLTTLDVMAIDTHGSEWDILKNMPWDLVDIKV